MSDLEKAARMAVGAWLDPHGMPELCKAMEALSRALEKAVRQEPPIRLESGMDEYEYKTYGVARFEVQGGLYSIQELEDLLYKFKAAKRRQDEVLVNSMRLNNKGVDLREAKLKEKNGITGEQK